MSYSNITEAAMSDAVLTFVQCEVDGKPIPDAQPHYMPRSSASKPSQQPYGLLTWLIVFSLLAFSIIARGHFLYGV